MIYITGDTHGGIDIEKLLSHKFTPADTIIICGDFGYVFHTEKAFKEVEKTKLELLLKFLNCTLVFCGGNHENYDRLYSKEFPIIKKYGSTVKEIADNCYMLLNGHLYNIEGYNFLAVGGAESHDMQFRKAGVNWWAEESITLSDMEKSYKHYKNADFIITHCAPTTFEYKILLELGFYPQTNYKSPQLLERLLQKLEYSNCDYKWFCGHYHTDFNFRNFYCLYNKIYCVDTGDYLRKER